MAIFLGNLKQGRIFVYLKTGRMTIELKIGSRELLQQVYNSFNARNIDSALEVIHPHVDWANGFEGGFVQGHEELRSYWLRQWEFIDPYVKPVGFAQDGDGNVVVDAHQIIRDLSGNIVSIKDVQHVFHIEDGYILTMRIR